MESNSNHIVQALKISDVNMKDINFDNVIKNKKVKMGHKNGKFICQTPYLEVISINKSPIPDVSMIDTLFSGDSKRRAKMFYQFLENLELHISSHVSKYGDKWFKEKNVTLKSISRENDGIHFI